MDTEAQNHYFLLSSRGCEQLSKLSKEDEDNYAVAYLHVGGFKFMPVKDESGKVIGTTLFNVQSSNPGGNIPNALSNKVGPPEALRAMENFIKVVQKHTKFNALAAVWEAMKSDEKEREVHVNKAIADNEQKKNDEWPDEDKVIFDALLMQV